MEINAYVDENKVSKAVADKKHREIIGGLWDELGKKQFDFLVSKGLKPESKLIDVGCGCLRGGVYFIEYLDIGNYYGIDRSASILEAGRAVELESLGLGSKLPAQNLICNTEFDLSSMPVDADFAIAQSLFSHLPLNDIMLCLERVAQKLTPGARFFVTFFNVPESHPFGSPFKQAGGITTHSTRDPFHYRLSDIQRICEGLPWSVQLLGDWDHPRGQQMLEFTRLTDVPKESGDRSLTYQAAAGLRTGAEHYRAYVGPPDRFDFMSATQFALLHALGLRDHHKVLDFGCGSLRLGRLLIPFLQAGCYFGIDPNSWLIADAFDRELGRSIRAIKNPNFSNNDNFACDVFGVKFDFIVAQSIITHCGAQATRTLIEGAAKALNPKGKFIFSIIEDPIRDAKPSEEGWIYPRCVSYGAAAIADFCASAGLVCCRLPWYHPGATWYMAAQSTAQLPNEREMPLLRGAVLFEPQFERSRPFSLVDQKPANPLVTFASYADAVAAGKVAEIGKAELLEPTKAVAGQYGQFRIRFIAGSKGLQRNAIVRVALRHVCQWTPPQEKDPKAPGFTTVACATSNRFSIKGWDKFPDKVDLFGAMFPWQHVIDISPLDQALAPGEQIEIVYGDQSQGGPGVRSQCFEEKHFSFRVYVDALGNGRFLPTIAELSIPIIGGDMAKLVLVSSSDAIVGRKTRLLVRAEDRYGNIAKGYRGRHSLSFFDGNVEHRREVSFGEIDEGICIIEELAFEAPGIYTFILDDRVAESNPIRVRTESVSGFKTYWGEIHGHTLLSDGRGTVEDYYEYAENVSGLDVCAVTDHDFMLSDVDWAHSKRVTNARNKNGKFVTLQAFEWSGTAEVGGDRNVYFVEDDPPIARSRSFYDYRNPHAFHGSGVQANHVEDLFNFIIERCPAGTALVVPHFGGRAANLKWHRPDLERLVEVFSEHKRSEGWANLFRKNRRMGSVAGGDDHICRPGNGFLAYDDSGKEQPYGLGLVAIQAQALTREDVFEALYNRRVYATTGARILLDVTINEHPMGSELICQGPPALSIETECSSDIAVVQILRDGRVVHEQYPSSAYIFDEEIYIKTHVDVAKALTEGKITSGHAHYISSGAHEGRMASYLSTQVPGSRSASFGWYDAGLDRAAKASYVVRVQQADGHLAVSSPIVCDVRAIPRPPYERDGLKSNHNSEFMDNRRFQRAYARGVAAVGRDYYWQWRVHVGLWAGRTAIKIPGDFIEFGTNRGFMSSAIMEDLDWNSRDKKFYLLDTFSGLDERFVSDEEKNAGYLERNKKEIDKGFYTVDVEKVKQNFSSWKNVFIIKGSVPITLESVDADIIAFAHIDMNCAPPEVAAMRYIWPKLSPGAIVLFDDYAYKGYEFQKVAIDNLGKELGYEVLSLPTGQGLMTKPA